MYKNRNLSLEEWRTIGNIIKTIRDERLKLLGKLNEGGIPKSIYIDGLEKIEKGVMRLQNKLEDRLLHQHPDLSDAEFQKYFYGEQ